MKLKLGIAFGTLTFCVWLAWLGAAMTRPIGVADVGAVYTPVWMVWALFGAASVLTAICAALLAEPSSW